MTTDPEPTAGERRTLVVIPVLDEIDHLDRLLDQLTGEVPSEVDRILVLDGGSSDGSAEVADRWADRDPRVIARHNPGRTQARAINAAVHEHAGHPHHDYLVRVDAHAVYPAGYVTHIIERLVDTGADSVVVPMRTLPGNRWQNAASIVFNSWIGSGGSIHRSGGVSGWTDHGHHAGFKVDTFRNLGGYDSEFTANEDAEYDVRLGRAGGRVYLDTGAEIGYIPRDSVTATFRQYARNGRWRFRTHWKHRALPSPARLLPVAAVTAEVVTIALALVTRRFLPLALPAAHAVTVMAAVGATNRRLPIRNLADATVLTLAAHTGAGVGFVAQALAVATERSPSILRPDRKFHL